MFSIKKKKPIVTVFDIQGTITTSNSFSNRSYDHYDLLRDLHEARKDKDVIGAVMRINSPGGSAGASSELANEISAFKKEKSIVASISDLACSGAYLAASATSSIFCSGMGVVGSIGVIMQIPDLTGASEKIGFGMRTVKSAKRKDIGNPFREMTEDERKFLEDLVDNTHLSFVEAISRNRDIDIEAAKEIADGRIFNPEEAKSLKLIDEIGTFYDAMDFLLVKVGLLEDDVKIEYREEEGFISRILSRLSLQNMISSQSGLFLK